MWVPSSSANRSPLSSTWAHVYPTDAPPPSRRVAPELLFERKRWKRPMHETPQRSASVTHLTRGTMLDRARPRRVGIQPRRSDQVRLPAGLHLAEGQAETV